VHDAADIDGNLPALRTDLRAEVIIIITYSNVPIIITYLFQRISIMLQRFNSVLLHDTLPVDLPDL